jgi:hypothetical protein
MIVSTFRRLGRGAGASSSAAVPGPTPPANAPAAPLLPADAPPELRRAFAAMDAARARAAQRQVVTVATPPSPMRAASAPARSPAAAPASVMPAAVLAPSAAIPGVPAGIGPAPPTAGGRSFIGALSDPLRTRDAVVLSEILAPPVALR